MKELNDINSIRFPLINIRRTSNLAVAPINTFGLAIGLFMLAAPLMEWCEFKSPTLGVIFACGGVCQYIIGIYDWYQNKTILCFIDFIFSFLHFLLYYFVYFNLFIIVQKHKWHLYISLISRVYVPVKSNPYTIASANIVNFI